MDCVRCGARSEYDRVAISRASKRVEGSLCIECEESWLREQSAVHGFSIVACFNCGGDPAFLFPRWDAIIENEVTGSTHTEYRIRLTTPSSCQKCLTE